MATKLDVRVVALVFDGRKLLVALHRTRGKHDWFLHPPGGGIEGKETFEECAAREAFEETNQRIEIIRLAYVYDYMTEDGRCLNMFFLGRLKERRGVNTLNNPDENSHDLKDAQWIEVEELVKRDFRPKKLIEKIIEDKLWENKKLADVYFWAS